MATVIQVTAPVVIVRDPSGAQHYFYQGAVLPDGLDQEHVDQLVDEHMADEVEVLDPEESSSDVPAKSASKGDWETYARTQGATDADLDGKTKDELVAAYGA